MTSLVIAGDWHADTSHALNVIDAAAKKGALAVLQVGDFGYWPRHPAGRQFLTEVSSRCVDRGIGVWFCDGNHEDHSQLPHTRTTDPVELAESVWWVPRGTVLEWGDRRVLFMGGAVSVDKPRRRAGIDWFPNETPSQADFDRARRSENVDIVVAHEGLPDTPLVSNYGAFIPPEILENADRIRQEMGKIADAVTPSVWVHGHWHHRMSATRADVRVECLNESRAAFSETAIVCQLDTLDISPIG